MKQGYRKALALLLVSCLTLSACNETQESTTAAPTATSSDTSATSAEPTASSSGSKVDPQLVEEVENAGYSPEYFINESRVFFQMDVSGDVGGGSGAATLVAVDQNGNKKELGQIPNLWSFSIGVANIDADYYQFIIIATLVEEPEEDLLLEDVLLRFNLEKSEMELIHYDVGAKFDWMLPYSPAAFSVGRKIVTLDNYFEESETGRNLITLIETYNVDTKEWSRVMECSATNTMSKGEVLYQVCTDGEKIYALHDEINGGDSVTSLIIFDSNLQEIKRIEISDELKTVFNRGRIAHIRVWNDTLLVSYSSENMESMVFLGNIGDDGVKKVAEFEDTRVLQDDYNGAPILINEIDDTVYLFSEGTEPQKVHFLVEGVEEMYLVGCHVSGSDMCVSVFYTDPADISHDVSKDYIIHLDKLGAAEEIYLPK